MPSKKKEEKTLKTECKSPESLIKYLEEKAKNHKYFKMYSTWPSLRYKMEQECLFLSTGGNWNDVLDKRAFNPENGSSVNFGACFSFSESESVAMWMLYGGLQKEGVMVDFSRSQINTCLNSEHVTLGIWKGQEFFPITDLHKSQYSFQLIDILYIADSRKISNGYCIKRSSETHHIEKRFIDSVDCVKKAFPWNYENECRLILNIDANYIADSRINSAQIQLPEAYRTLSKEKRLYVAPNFRSSLDGFQESALSAKIDWDLCLNCTETQQQADRKLVYA